MEAVVELDAVKEANAWLQDELAQLKEAAEGDRKALVAEKETIETTRSVDLLAEKKLKAAKKEVDDLSPKERGKDQHLSRQIARKGWHSHPSLQCGSGRRCGTARRHREKLQLHLAVYR